MGVSEGEGSGEAILRFGMSKSGADDEEVSMDLTEEFLDSPNITMTTIKMMTSSIRKLTKAINVLFLSSFITTILHYLKKQFLLRPVPLL
jgi:hypothetical protein